MLTPKLYEPSGLNQGAPDVPELILEQIRT